MKETQRTDEDCHEEALKPRMLVLAPQQQPTTEGKNTPEKSRRRKIKELADARRGCVFETPSLCLSAYRCLLFSVVLIYFSVNVHEIILDDLIDRRLNDPTVFLI